MGCFTLLLVVISCQIGHLNANVKCLSCSHIPHARDCEEIATCGDHEVCFASQVVSDAGYIFREIGCRDRQHCPNTMARRSKRADDGDIVVCDECCETPFCQASMCADTDYPSDRGPICYNCPEQLEEAECDLITECSRDQVCFESLQKSSTGIKTLQTGCMSQPQCNALMEIALTSTSTSNSTGHHCASCCLDDLCNTSCSPTIIVTPTKVSGVSTSTAGVSTTTPTPCTDATEEATCILAEAVVCTNKDKARNAGCSHHCGFC